MACPLDFGFCHSIHFWHCFACLYVYIPWTKSQNEDLDGNQFTFEHLFLVCLGIRTHPLTEFGMAKWTNINWNAKWKSKQVTTEIDRDRKGNQEEKEQKRASSSSSNEKHESHKWIFTCTIKYFGIFGQHNNKMRNYVHSNLFPIIPKQNTQIHTRRPERTHVHRKVVFKKEWCAKNEADSTKPKCIRVYLLVSVYVILWICSFRFRFRFLVWFGLVDSMNKAKGKQSSSQVGVVVWLSKSELVVLFISLYRKTISSNIFCYFAFVLSASAQSIDRSANIEHNNNTILIVCQSIRMNRCSLLVSYLYGLLFWCFFNCGLCLLNIHWFK